MSEASNCSVVENRVSSKKVGVFVSFLINVAVASLELSVDSTTSNHERHTA
jgi:hypothetical protein